MRWNPPSPRRPRLNCFSEISGGAIRGITGIRNKGWGGWLYRLLVDKPIVQGCKIGLLIGKAGGGMYQTKPDWWSKRGGPYYHIWILDKSGVTATLERYKTSLPKGPGMYRQEVITGDPAVWRTPQAARDYGNRYYHGRFWMVRQCWAREGCHRWECPVCSDLADLE